MKNYFRRFIHLSMLSVFMMISWSCIQNSRKVPSYPSPQEKWPNFNCIFIEPFTVEYFVLFKVAKDSIKITSNGTYTGIGNAKVTCKVRSHVQIPIAPDTCYQNTSVQNTFTVFTIDEGQFLGQQALKFNFTFGSTFDYFILEITVEKEGYITQRTSQDYRWYYANDQWLPRYLFSHELEENEQYNFMLLPENINP